MNMKMNKKTILRIAIVAIILVLIIFLGNILEFITNYMWFKEVGYTNTFFTKLKSQLMIGIPLFIILFAIFFIYLNMTLNKNYGKDKIIEFVGSKKNRNIWYIAGALILSLFITINIVSKMWFEILQFNNSTNFNLFDPIFNNEISFYMFKLPLISSILDLVIKVIVILLIITVVVNVLSGAKSTFKNFSDQFSQGFNPGQRINFSKNIDKKTIIRIINQIAITGAILLVLFGIKIYLGTFEILYSPRGRVFGAGYTDVAVSLNMYRIMAILCVVAAVTFFIGAKKRNLKIALVLPVAVILVSIIGTATAAIVEKFVVEPDQLSKESIYMENNIKFTQLAYGLDKVNQIDFKIDNNLTKDDIDKNREVIENIRINDKAPLNQVYNKLQGIRPYYTFNDVDIDRYVINGDYQQVFLSARELDQNLLNSQAKTWINQYLKYTHGYGISLSRVNKVTAQGQPELLIKDIPPTTNTDLVITRPEIYFGEKANSYIIVNTDEKEFDYPSGSNNVESIYEGEAGINLNFLNKLMFAIREGSFNMFISGNINSNSKIVINRNIINRVNEIAPFIAYDNDPYIVINQEDGKLYWIIEGFTISSRFPYSQPINNSSTNYIRNSVKVVIDAYNGKTDFYIVDENDPVIMTYSKIFTDLFKPISEMPEGLRSHIRYSQEMFSIQAEMYRTYHMDNTTVFFGREDIWDISKEKYLSGEQQVEPNYYMFKLPEEKNIEFLLTVPYTPQGKDNMSGLFVARNDGDNYGELILYKFPKNMTVQGTALIESKIDQDTEISSQLTLWSQKGSNVLRGNTLIIPIENSLLYVEPIYLQADTESNFPEMKMVVVAYKDKILMESSLDVALDKILGDIYNPNANNRPPIGDEITDNGTMEELITKANTLFTEANNALKNGNWALYGEKMNELEKILNKLNTMTNQ